MAIHIPVLGKVTLLFPTEVNSQKILDNVLAFLHGAAEDEFIMSQHGCLSQFSINTLIIVMTLCLVMQYFCTMLLSMAIVLEFSVAHTILVMPALFYGIFRQEIFLQQLQRNENQCTLSDLCHLNKSWHDFHFSIILCIECWKDFYISIIFSVCQY